MIAGKRSERLFPWAAVALALHFSLVFWLRDSNESEPEAQPSSTALQPIEVELVHEAARATEVETSNEAIRAQQSSLNSARSETSPSREGRQNQLVPTPATSAGVESGDLPVAQPEVGGAEVASAPPLDSALGAPASGAPASGAPASSAVPSGAGPSASNGPLSLADLGIGTHHAAVVAPYLKYDPLARAQERLDQTLAQGSLDADKAKSVGIEGPISKALHAAAMGVGVPTSSSKFSILIGSNGKLAHIEVLSSTQDDRMLTALSDRVKRLLADQVVRVPNGRPVEFIYELESKIVLPSGRPALAKKTEDLADIGATGRQVVHTRMLRQRVL